MINEFLAICIKLLVYLIRHLIYYKERKSA